MKKTSQKQYVRSLFPHQKIPFLSVKKYSRFAWALSLRMKERASSANFFADNDDLLVTSRLIERKRFFKFFILIKLSYKTLKKKKLLRTDGWPCVWAITNDIRDIKKCGNKIFECGSLYLDAF